MRYTIAVMSLLTILILTGCESLPLADVARLVTPSEQRQIETESYRMTIDSVKKSENVLKMDLTFENLTSKILPLSLTTNPDYTYLLDDIGEKWTLRQADTAGIFVEGGSIQLAPDAKRKTTVTFASGESGGGDVYTFVFWEGQPQRGRTHTLRRIRAEAKPKEASSPLSLPTSTSVLETESYQMNIDTINKSGNILKIDLIFQNLTSNILPLSMTTNPDYTYILDDIGEKWTLKKDDTAGIFVEGVGIQLAPRAKRKTTATFLTQESGEGNTFSLVFWEGQPQRGRTHTLQRIKAEQKPTEVSPPPPEPASSSVLETESYRMNIDSINKSGSVLKIDITFENLTSKIMPLSLTTNPDYTYLLDDIGEKWAPKQADTAGIFEEGVGIQLAPGAKRRTTVTFVTNESGGGNTFSLVFWEGQPQRGRTHTLHRIKAEQK